MIASYIVGTLGRPDLLRHSLRCMCQSKLPDGWALEVVVCCPGDDGESAQVAHEAGCVVTHASSTAIGAQYTAALMASQGSVAIISGDDDLNDPLRVHASIKAWESGSLMFGFAPVSFVHVPSGKLATWVGPIHRAGAAMGFDARMLKRVGGWGDTARNLDATLHERLLHDGYPATLAKQMGGKMGRRTAFLDHDKRTSGVRPFPRYGETVAHGSFAVTGRGRALDYDYWSAPVRESLEAILKR